MHHAHALGVGFLREKAVLHKFLGEEYHMVHPSIEESGKSFAERVLRLDDGLMMPSHNRMPVKSKCTKQDNGFYAVCVCGIKDVVRLATNKDFPSGNNRIVQALVSMPLVMPNNINPIIGQLQSPIKEVRREQTLLPFPNNSLCVLGVVEIYSPPFGGVGGRDSSTQPRHAFHKRNSKETYSKGDEQDEDKVGNAFV